MEYCLLVLVCMHACVRMFMQSHAMKSREQLQVPLLGYHLYCFLFLCFHLGLRYSVLVYFGCMFVVVYFSRMCMSVCTVCVLQRSGEGTGVSRAGVTQL